MQIQMFWVTQKNEKTKKYAISHSNKKKTKNTQFLLNGTWLRQSNWFLIKIAFLHFIAFLLGPVLHCPRMFCHTFNWQNSARFQSLFRKLLLTYQIIIKQFIFFLLLLFLHIGILPFAWWDWPITDHCSFEHTR
jgi:hypothetical protein